MKSKRVKCMYCQIPYHIQGMSNHLSHCKVKKQMLDDREKAVAARKAAYEATTGRPSMPNDIQKASINDGKVKIVNAVGQMLQSVAAILDNLHGI